MSGKKLVGKRQIQKKAQISVNNSVQNISDDDFLEEGTSHDSAAVLFFSPNTSSFRAFLSDESVTSSSINNYAMDCINSSLSESNKDPDSNCIDSSLSELNQELDIEPLVVRLRRWYCSSRVNLTQLKMLLTELKPDHPDLPSDPRCIVQTPVYVNIKPLNNGGYVHAGIKHGLVKRMKSGIKPNCLQLDIDINIDGLPVSKSSSVDVWPILGRCIKLYDQRPFVIGLFCGSGVTKRFLSYLTLKAKSPAKLRASDTNKISGLLEEFHTFIPREFARKSRSLHYAARWKATEHRLFLLYTGIVALKQVLSQELYDLFLLLHVAVRIVSCEQLVKKQAYVDFAEKLFAAFVKHCAHPTVFGPGFVSYNIHSLLHLCEDVRRYGVIENFSGFPFENYLGVIKRLIRSGAKVLQQLARRLAEMDWLYDLQQLPLTSWLPSGYNSSTNEYKTVSNKNFTLSTNLKDSFFYSNGNVAQVKKILKSENRIVLIADVCHDIHDFFENPIKSSKVGIWKFDSLSHRNVPVSLETVCGKCIVLPFKNEFIAFRLLHTF